jgi:8-oxo-dGTP pyrophosphatase MutT (NUDIX family)
MDVIRAAGGVIERSGRVVLVHRPKYDDWSFPKGKLDEGETFEQAALREVEEETGLTCELLDYLTDIEYGVESGARKIVRFWRMSVLGGDIGDHIPDREIDRVEWVRFAVACDRLTYPIDKDLLGRVSQEECS